jgi:hypothetical protein
MLKAYLDESGHHEGSKAFAFAGFLGRAYCWSDFNREWNAVLYNFPGVSKPFHMKDWSHPKIPGHQFSGWPTEKRHELINRLLDVLLSNPPKFFAFGFSVEVEAFARVPDTARENFYNDPYFLAFQSCVGAAAKSMDEHYLPLNEKVGFICDRKSGYVGRITDMYNHMKDDIGWNHVHRLADEIAFGSRAEYPGLQAADILAYLTTQDLDARLSSPSDAGAHTPRYILNQIVTRCGCEIKRWDDVSFEKNLPYMLGPVDRSPQ